MSTLNKHSTEPIQAPSPVAPGGLLSDLAGREALARGLFVLAAALSFGLSVVLYFTGDELAGIFVGIWVPSILSLGSMLVPRRPAHRDGGTP